MALNKTTLKTTIKNGIAGINMSSPNISNQITDIICDAIDTYVKSATVNISAGIPVATTGTAAAQTGSTTAPATGTLT